MKPARSLDIRAGFLIPAKALHKDEEMKTQKGKYVPLNTDFTVTVSKDFGRNRFDWEPDAVYITHDRREVNLHYAGEKAGESSAIFSLPAESSFLRELASALEGLADEYDN